MCAMDRLRIGRSIHVLRIRRGLRQLDLAGAARISRAKVARAEAGDLLRMPIGDLLAVVEALSADLDVRIRWRGAGAP